MPALGAPAVGVLAVGILALGAPAARAQSLYVERLPGAVLAVKPPAERVRGAPGEMQVVETACRSEPLAGVRERIIDVALQEWAYFGFSVADETSERGARPGRAGSVRGGPARDGSTPGESVRGDIVSVPPSRRSWRNFSWLSASESARLAASIAGYWAVTGDGAWIVSRQNEVWNGSGIGARWRDPWSAAFISWVMCESGLDNARFERAINHHTYIDQAIRARDAGSVDTAYVAYDVGEQPIEPGDLVCTARRPSYATLDERRRQLGEGVSAHCDIVLRLEPEFGRILAVGGNVRGSVSLKLLPAEFRGNASAPVPDGALLDALGSGRSHVFAHLKLRDAPLDGDAFRLSPTLRAIDAEPALLERVRATLAPVLKRGSEPFFQ